MMESPTPIPRSMLSALENPIELQKAIHTSEPHLISERPAELLEICEETTQVATSTALLADLEPLDRLFITRSLKCPEMLIRGKKNQFFVKNTDEHLVYTVQEENSWWVGYFCLGLRPFQLIVTNSLGAVVMRINRPYSFTTRILPCSLQTLQVYSPPDHLIGSVEQQWTPIKPLYLITNKDGEELFWIHGPCVTLSCYNDVQFHVQRPNGAVIGATCKHWEGLKHALFFSPFRENFGVAFDQTLTQVEKALLLASSFLLDYLYYDV